MSSGADIMPNLATDRGGMKAQQRPLVSVIIPTFNSGKLITRAVRSALAQTYDRLEIIIADDASKDDTRQKVEAIPDRRVIFLESAEATNKGPAATRNRGLAEAEGKYVAFLDSDDEWFSEKLARQVDYLEANPACSIVVTNAYDISPTGKIIGTEFGGPQPPKSGSDAWRVLLKYSFIETSSVMSRLSLVREIGGFDPNLLVSQDQDLWIRLALQGDVGIIEEIMGQIHQVVTGHMTRNRLRQVDIMLPMIEGHVDRLKARLSKCEIDDILGHRYQKTGRAFYFDREYLLGIRLLVKASVRNGRWLDNFLYTLHANPFGVLLKGMIRSAFGGSHRAARRAGRREPSRN